MIGIKNFISWGRIEINWILFSEDLNKIVFHNLEKKVLIKQDLKRNKTLKMDNDFLFNEDNMNKMEPVKMVFIINLKTVLYKKIKNLRILISYNPKDICNKMRIKK